MNNKNIAILGSTGSIGKQTLEVISWYPDKFKVSALTANTDVKTLEEQCRKYKPRLAVMQDTHSAIRLKERLQDTNIQVLAGMDGLTAAASIEETDIVVTAVSGAVGVIPTLAAIRHKKRIALANKETLVAAGNIVMEEARKYNAEIIPVDSEHSAVFQCFGHGKNVRRIILTASGGPFRGKKREELANITKEKALKHPSWVMGAKITIDSATLMNKGLEVIEAHHLFGLPGESIDVVVHPQSIIHSMVEYGDGSIISHLGRPDMRIPIQYALSYPERISNQLESLDFAALGQITFEKPDLESFKSLRHAYDALSKGGIIPAVLNAANEEVVNAFLLDKCKFLDIADIVEEVMNSAKNVIEPTLAEIMSADKWAREKALDLIGR